MAHPEIARLFGSEKLELVEFVERTEEASGAHCFVYRIEGDDKRDLGIIVMEPGAKTPLQRVLGGDRTIEGLIAGEGTLTVIREGEIREHHVNESRIPFSVEVRRGDLMQWRADPYSRLVAFEVCYPPYQPDRFENLPE